MTLLFESCHAEKQMHIWDFQILAWIISVLLKLRIHWTFAIVFVEIIKKGCMQHVPPLRSDSLILLRSSTYERCY